MLATSEGFNTADDALKNGIKQGFKYLGMEHYSTSKNVSGHVLQVLRRPLWLVSLSQHTDV